MRATLRTAFLLLALGGFACTQAANSTSIGEDGDEVEYHTFTSMMQELKFSDGFYSSLSMVLVSELGDETFIIAAIMAMRHPRIIVLGGALSALWIMTVISTGLGLIVPKLITRKTTARLAGILYTFFGMRLMYIGWRSDPNQTAASEFEEVEEKIDVSAPPKSKFRRAMSRFLTPIFLEAFVLTFLAEWGDRSQVTTVALASHQNPVGVTVGGCIGHTFCTSLAVIGGRLMATKISQRTVAFTGGILFIIFAMHSFYSSSSS
mmetsp:Transcript_34206/g.74772  ORF Transcript_34206/g.74772 Transcript_34206/m.74772 type:complete len:263 (-) Transcript_34206:189-977(-)|eukprot:CAMPEP_0118933820 /NCGR_PEP_ID=MMETSP1169-20130426/12627_1 /TAXON_ID=36882 /ORGANISM="Pyramimonas obovata, Strain CCMP722" /LENGTH=262 /DNA_ID=CAMNT_0006876639 /DNA_START=148 /DNA_END=936 /DNA_ORIENTATION=-